MISHLNKNNLAPEEIESFGSGFATRYYDALMGKPNASNLRQFYNNQSKYVFVQPGRPDYEMEGLFLIGRFLKRMEYTKCTVIIRSVVTARRAHPTEFTVSSVCELSRPEDNVPRTFTQSSVVKRVPWTSAQFQIAITEFKFHDDNVDFSIPIAVADKPKGSSTIITETLNKLVNPMVVSNKKAAGKPKVAGTSVDRKLNHPGKKSTITSIPAGSRALNGKVRSQLSPRRTENTEKPIITMMQPVANNASKDESKKTQTTVNKTVGDKDRKDMNNVRRAMSVRPTHGDRKIFVSSNRYGCLAAVDKYCLADVQENPGYPFSHGRSKKSKCTKSTAAESNESQKSSQAVEQDPEEQQIAFRIPAMSIMSTISADTSSNLRKKSDRRKKILSAVSSSERVIKTLAKSDELIVRKAAVRLVGTGDEGHCKGSTDQKKEKKTKTSVKTVQRNSQDERPEVVHQLHTPKHRPIDPLVPTVSDQHAPNEANGMSKKSRRNRKKNGCKRNNGVVASSDSNEVVVVGPYYSYIRRLGQGWAFIKESVYPMFFNLTFNPLNW